MDHAFFQQLTEPTTIITANQRLARQLTQSFDQYHHQQTQPFNSLDALPLTAWLERSWLQTQPTQYLLSSVQLETLWYQTIQEHVSSQQWLLPQNTAQLACQAWSYLLLWKIPLTELTTNSPETALLLEWIKIVEKKLTEKNTLTEYHLPQKIATHFTHINPTTWPKQIILLGFDDFPPALTELWDCLKTQIALRHYQYERPTAKTSTQLFDHPDTELQAMAAWAKQTLDQEPETQIACIVPNLTEQREKIWQTFMATFSPAYWQPGQTPSQYRTHGLSFNLSAGEKFHHLPLIKTAIQALRLTLQSSWPRDSLYTLFRQAFLHTQAQDRFVAAEVDQYWRECGLVHINLEILKKTQLRFEENYPKNTLLKRFYKALSTRHPQYSAYRQWAPYICTWLQQLGWPGHRSLNSTETQALERWRTLQNEWMSLSLLNDSVNWYEAITGLERLAQGIVFQPRTDYAPVQVLGTLEAAGSFFDAVWLMGLTADLWPPKAAPNPFLPFHLQKKYQLPHATSARELAYCQNVLQRILQSAPQMIISFAKQDNDRPLRPSPLLKNIVEEENLSLTTDITIKITNPKLEFFTDDIGPPCKTEENIRGSSALLQQQANCPFQSFAHFRLKAQGLNPTQWGLNPAERGILLHKALEYFWTTVTTQENLQQLSIEEKNNQIAKAVDFALTQKNHFFKNTIFQEIEQNRLAERLSHWLDIEYARDNFTVVGFEHKITYSYKNIHFQLSVDRIDQFSDSHMLVIDYKTGLTSTRGWLDERLTAPQLPLYSLALGTECQGIAFGIIQSKKNTLKGLYAGRELITGLQTLNNTEWQDLQKSWQEKIEILCEEFRQGTALVNPAYPDSCQYCDLQTLCRIHQEDHHE